MRVGHRRVAGLGLALAVAVVSGAAGQTRTAVDAWLGTFAAGAERLSLAWEAGGLCLQVGAIAIPVDGEWHETVPTFAVRHRATWIATRAVLAVDEQHNRGAHWRHELRLDAGGERLRKVVIDAAGGAERVQRTYTRVAESLVQARGR